MGELFYKRTKEMKPYCSPSQTDFGWEKNLFHYFSGGGGCDLSPADAGGGAEGRVLLPPLGVPSG